MRQARKTQQLCAQVQRSLSVALAGLEDEALQGLCVEQVEPYPDASRLLVLVRHWDGDEYPRVELMERLSEFKGELRSEVAAAIHRKKTPELSFEVMLTGEVRTPDENAA